MAGINEVMLQLKVEGGEIVARELDQVGDATGRLGDEAEEAAEKTGRTSEVMAGLKRAARLGAVAVGAMGAQSIWAGLKMNENFERARVSFGVMLDDMDGGAAFIDRLRTITADSPLRLTDYMESAQQMLAFGMEADQTMRTLQGLDKAIVGSAKSGEEMQHVAQILGQMSSSGKVSAVDITRLGRSGLQVNEILQDAFGLTGEQVRNIGHEGLEADKVVSAIATGWAKKYKNANKEMEDTGYYQRMLATKNFEQFQREAMEPLFNFLKSTGYPILNKVISLFLKMPEALKAATVGSAALAGVWAAMSLIGLGALMPWIVGIGALAAAIYIFREEIWGFLEPIVDWFTNAGRNIADWVSTAASNIAGFVTALLPVRIAIDAVKDAVEKLGPAWGPTFRALGQIVGLFADVFGVYFAFVGAQIKLAWKLIKRLGAIIGNVVAIVSNLLRGDWAGAWKAAEALVGNVVGGIKDLISGMLDVVTIIPIKILGVFKGLPGRINTATGGMFDGIKDAIKGPINYVIERVNWLLEKLRGFNFKIPGAVPIVGGQSIGIPGVPGNIDGLADGGTLSSAGSVLVGERGPELLNLPRAAQVVPLDGKNQSRTVVEVPVFLNGREIARAFSGEIQNAQARA